MNAADRSEFERFYEAHYPMAYGYLSRVIRNADDAYDVLIHSFELALARFDEYLKSHNRQYWFFGIIRNSASYFLRKRAQEHSLLVGVTRHGSPSSVLSRTMPVPRATPTPEEILLRNEHEGLLKRVLEALPEKYREVALLRFQDFSHKEIAAALGISVEAVESRMRRAIVKLEPFYAEFKAGKL